MYIQNRRDCCKISYCSPLQNCNGLNKFESLNCLYFTCLPLSATLNKRLTVQILTMIYGQNEKCNYSKAVLAITSIKAKEMHNDFIFNFGVHHIYFYSNTQKKIQPPKFIQ